MLVKLHLIAPRLKKSSMGIYGQMTNISSLCTKDLRLCAICYLKRDAYMFIAIGTRFIILDYEVEFKSGGMEYSYEINAATGAILKHEAEIDD